MWVSSARVGTAVEFRTTSSPGTHTRGWMHPRVLGEVPQSTPFALGARIEIGCRRGATAATASRDSD